MAELDTLLKKLVKTYTQVGSKIVQFIEKDKTGKATYDKIINEGTDNQKVIKVADGLPIDGTPIIYGIQLSLESVVVNEPVVGSYGLILFTNNYDAYIIQLSNTKYTRIEMKNDDNTKTIVKVGTENNKSTVDVQSNDVHITTNKGGTFTIQNKTVLISNVDRLRFQVEDNDGVLKNELMLDKTDGISLVSYDETPIEIRNGITNLKDVLFNLIDTFANATYVSPVGSAVVNPASLPLLLAYKNELALLLK